MADDSEKFTPKDWLVLLFCIVAVVGMIAAFFADRRDYLSYLYDGLHPAPICSVIKTNPDGSPSDFLCKRISVTASAELWNKMKDYKPSKRDIRATTVQYDEKHITWSKDVIKKDFNPQH